jgi:epoxide hydrolase
VIDDIDGIRVHAIVAEPADDTESATPLLLLHGWPGSVAEMFDVIESLRVRHRVIVASLPGYGFSGPTTKSGVGPLEIATTLVELMRRLGHARFVVAGGDWGAIVGSWLAAHHPERCSACI